MKILKSKIKNYLIVPVICVIGLTSCASGVRNCDSSPRFEVTGEFLDGLIEEQPEVDANYPYTSSVVDDWIVQNAP
jgi:hypothetical protein